MTRLSDVFGRADHGLQRLFFWGGRLAILAMLVVTLIDILGRSFLSRPLPGVVDMVELMLAWSIFLGIALAFRRGLHLVVDLTEILIPPAILRWLDRLNALVTFGVLCWLARLAWHEYLDKLDWGDTTVDLGIPLTWYWLTALSGFIASAAFVAARELISLRRPHRVAAEPRAAE